MMPFCGTQDVVPVRAALIVDGESLEPPRGVEVTSMRSPSSWSESGAVRIMLKRSSSVKVSHRSSAKQRPPLPSRPSATLCRPLPQARPKPLLPPPPKCIPWTVGSPPLSFPVPIPQSSRFIFSTARPESEWDKSDRSR